MTYINNKSKYSLLFHSFPGRIIAAHAGKNQMNQCDQNQPMHLEYRSEKSPYHPSFPLYGYRPTRGKDKGHRARWQSEGSSVPG